VGAIKPPLLEAAFLSGPSKLHHKLYGRILAFNTFGEKIPSAAKVG